MSNNIIIDIDGVLADFEGEFCKVFGYYKNRHLISLTDRLPSKAEEISDWVRYPYAYQNLEPIPLGLKVVQHLHKQGLDVCLVSSRPDIGGMLRVTYEWLVRNNVPFASLSIGAGDKVDAVQRLKPIMIIDDIPSILEKSRLLGILSVVFDQPWNKSARFPRISKIEDLGWACSYLAMEFNG